MIICLYWHFDEEIKIDNEEIALRGFKCKQLIMKKSKFCRFNAFILFCLLEIQIGNGVGHEERILVNIMVYDEWLLCYVINVLMQHTTMQFHVGMGCDNHFNLNIWIIALSWSLKFLALQNMCDCWSFSWLIFCDLWSF